jgi:hypothetical protein
VIVPLEWGSQHFGLPVACVEPAGLENEAGCRLFESFAYEAVGTPEKAYHFWLESNP